MDATICFSSESPTSSDAGCRLGNLTARRANRSESCEWLDVVRGRPALAPRFIASLEFSKRSLLPTNQTSLKRPGESTLGPCGEMCIDIETQAVPSDAIFADVAWPRFALHGSSACASVLVTRDFSGGVAGSDQSRRRLDSTLHLTSPTLRQPASVGSGEKHHSIERAAALRPLSPHARSGEGDSSG